MNYKIIKENLIKKNGNRCSICGENFTTDNLPEIDHIVPVSFGGNSELNNMQLVCSLCHRTKENKLISSGLFEEYIRKIIAISGKYEIVNLPKFSDKSIDLVLKDNTKQECIICEIKTSTSFTTDRLNYIKMNLKECEETVKKLYNNIKSVFIFPGKLSPKNESFFKKNGIEVWDKDYLISQFKNEILKLNIPYFKSLLRIEENKSKTVVNIYQEKINRLISCKQGRENWSGYQKLVGEILELLFCPNLEKPIGELYDQNKANRRDFIMPNYTLEGFWNFMRQNYSADYIVIDAKNSAKGVKKQDVLQISNYLKKQRYRIIWNHHC